MTLQYKRITIYTSEDIHYRGKPICEALTNYVSSLKLAARCMVSRGIMGCYENGEIASPILLELSYHMPTKIEIIIPAAEFEAVIPVIETMVEDGVIAVDSLNIHSYKTSKRFIPNNLKVKDVMTLSPATLTPQSPVSDILKLMLDSPFNGLPVIDATKHVVGIISQNDLSTRLHIPLRIGLMMKLDRLQVTNCFEELSDRKAEEIMTHPVKTVKEDQSLIEAVQLMLKYKLKRVPVLNDRGLLTGMLARIDIFRAITKQAPKWRSLENQAVQIGNAHYVKDIMTRDLDTVTADMPVLKLFEMIYNTDMQRVAVVDEKGRLLGVVSDDDLLPLVSQHPLGLKEFLVSKLTFTQKGREFKEYIEKMLARTVGDVMTQKVVSIHEDEPLEVAIKLMIDNQLKRLPVIDGDGVFQGMLSREAVLQKAVE